MRIVVYHLPERDKVLYNLGQLLEKLCQTKKIGVFCDESIIDIIDKTLWTFSSNIFLPHDIASGELNIDDLQPVLVSSNIEFLNREIICVFNNTNLFEVLSSIKKNTCNNIEDIIYMTQEDLDFELIKSKTDMKIDCFEKHKNTWSKKEI